MNNKEIPLLPGKRYHIYNHANGKENLYATRENYLYFLKLFGERIDPLAKTFAYCLMPNHIHFALEIRSETNIVAEWEGRQKASLEHGKSLKPIVKISDYLALRFGKFFQAYSQAFNKQQKRMGSLFIPNFKRKEVESQTYLNTLVHYIHSNPVHHGFAKNIMDWEFSSIHAYWLERQTRLAKMETMESFGGREKFEMEHKTTGNYKPEFEFE
jgi:putative transposase